MAALSEAPFLSGSSRDNVYSYVAHSQLNESFEEDKENSFCVADNVHECASYISNELEALGFDCVVTTKGVDVVKMVNAVRGLLKLYRSSVSKIEDLTSSLHRSQSDMSLQWSTQAKLQSDLESAESEIISLRERERQSRTKNKTLATKLRAECEEGKRLRLCMQSKTTQYCHDLKRKDKEYERLKDRLGQLLMDKAQGKKLGMKLLNGLQQQASRRPSKPSTGSTNQELYELMVTSYEDRIKELQLENASLRETIAVMDKELVSLLNMQKTRVSMDEEDDRDEESSETCHDAHHKLFTSGYLQMPFSLVREGIEQSLTQRYQQIRDYILMLKSNKDLPQQEYDTEMDILEQKLLDYRKIIEQQERMLQQQVASQQDGDKATRTPGLNESRMLQFLELNEDIEEQKRSLEKGWRNLQKSVRQFEKERDDFETKRSQYFKDRLFSTYGPTTPNRTAHFDSFFNSCSTPYPPSARKSPSSMLSPPGASVAVHSKSPIPPANHTKGGIDLSNSISLTSDDGDLFSDN